MPDPFRKVRGNEDLHLSATAWNAALEAGRAEQGRRHDRDAGERTTTRNAAIVRVKNETGADLGRNAVVGLDTPIFTPTDSVDAFVREVTFRGVTPASGHVGKFAVLLAPAIQDQVTRAYVMGVCPVRLAIADAAHTCADVDPGQTGRLTTSATGSAQILWREGGTSEQWAIVRLGSVCGTEAV